MKWECPFSGKHELSVDLVDQEKVYPVGGSPLVIETVIANAPQSRTCFILLLLIFLAPSGFSFSQATQLIC